MTPAPATPADDDGIDAPVGAAIASGASTNGTGWQRWVRHHHVLAALAVLVVVAPIVLTAVLAFSQSWLPTGDQAVIELRVHDVGTATPLTGPYSRYGWSHPGPLLYFLLAVPFRVLGNRSSALLVTTALVNALAVTGLAAVAWRRGRLALVLTTLAALSLVVHSFGPGLLRDPWNPYITLLPLALFVFVAWSVGEGDVRLAAPGALLATFLVQSHVAYAPVVGTVTLWTAWQLRRRVVERRAADEPPLALRIPLLLAGALAVLLWLPVLFDEVAKSHNLTSLAEFFAGSERAPVGFRNALELVSRELGGIGPWLGAPEPIDPLSGSVQGAGIADLWLPLGAFAASAIAAWRAGPRARAALRFQGLVGLVLVVAYVSLARVTDTVYDYLLRNWWVLAMLLWVSVVWSVWNAVHPVRLRFPRYVAAPAAVGAILFAVVPTGFAVADAPLPEPDLQGPVRTLADDTVSALPPHAPVIVRSVGLASNSVTDGMALQLERNDHRVAIDSEDTNKFGARRTTDAPAPALTVWVIGGEAIESWSRRTDVSAVASWDPLTPAERALWRLDAHALRDQLEALGEDELVHALATGDSLWRAHGLPGVDQALLERVEVGRRRGEPLVVFLGPPPRAEQAAEHGPGAGSVVPATSTPPPASGSSGPSGPSGSSSTPTGD